MIAARFQRKLRWQLAAYFERPKSSAASRRDRRAGAARSARRLAGSFSQRRLLPRRWWSRSRAGSRRRPPAPARRVPDPERAQRPLPRLAEGVPEGAVGEHPGPAIEPARHQRVAVAVQIAPAEGRPVEQVDLRHLELRSSSRFSPRSRVQTWPQKSQTGGAERQLRLARRAGLPRRRAGLVLLVRRAGSPARASRAAAPRRRSRARCSRS